MCLPDSVPEAEPDLIECRPERSQWAAVWVMLLCVVGSLGMMFMAAQDDRSPEQGQTIALAMFGLTTFLGLAGAVWLVLRIWRGFIAADAAGIHWRQVGRVREAKWPDVRDLYFTRVSSSNATYIIETSAGNLSFGSEWSSDRELALFIERHAAGTLGGWREGKRPKPRTEWPLRLSYRTFENRCLLPAISLVCLAALAAVDFSLLDAARNPSHGMDSLLQLVDLYGWPFVLSLFVIPGLLMCMALPALLGVFFFRTWLDAERRRHHFIEARPEGIAWTDGSRTVVSTWDEVRRIEMPHANHPLQARSVIQTDKGEFDFLHSLSRSAMLLSLLRERAHNVPAEDWEPRSPERPGPIRHGDGLLFGYRNRSARLLAWCATSFLLLPLAMMWVRSVTARADPDFLKGGVPWPLAAAGVALAIWVWRLYWTAWIRTDERGITQAGPLGQRFVAWPDVRKYLQSDAGFVVEAEISGRRRTIRFQSCISGLDELLDEIEKRATRSQNRRWRHQLPPVGVESGVA